LVDIWTSYSKRQRVPDFVEHIVVDASST